MRERQFNIRLSFEEDERIRYLSEYYGISVADVIRMLLKRDEVRILTELEKAHKK